MLLTHAQMRHYLNRYKILQLIVQALNFLIGDVGWFQALLVDFIAELVAALTSKSESFFAEPECVIKLGEERVAVREVQVCLCQWQQVLLSFRLLRCLKGFLQILNTRVHICRHISMLRHIVIDWVHYSFPDDNNWHVMWHFFLDKFRALAQNPACCSRLICFHELHGCVVAHGDVSVEQPLNLFVFLGAPASGFVTLLLNFFNKTKYLLMD